MDLPSLISPRTAEGRRIEAAEAAVSELDQRLAEWDEQRALVVADELGDDPHAHVSATWPTVAQARAGWTAAWASTLGAPSCLDPS